MNTEQQAKQIIHGITEHVFRVLYPSARENSPELLDLGTIKVQAKQTPAWKVIAVALDEAWQGVKGMYGTDAHAGFVGLRLQMLEPSEIGAEKPTVLATIDVKDAKTEAQPDRVAATYATPFPAPDEVEGGEDFIMYSMDPDAGKWQEPDADDDAGAHVLW